MYCNSKLTLNTCQEVKPRGRSVKTEGRRGKPKGQRVKTDGKKIEAWGLRNEYWAVDQLNNSIWLREKIFSKLGYRIEGLVYKILGTKKADLMDANNLGIQVKASKSNYGQVKRCNLNRFTQLFPQTLEIQYLLKGNFCLPFDNRGICVKNHPRKYFTTQFYQEVQLTDMLNILENNKRRIIEDVFLGRDKKFLPTLFMVIANSKTLIIWKTSDIIDQLCLEKWEIGNRGATIQLSSRNFSLQRKGGDSGRKSANDLQFKLRPCHLNRQKALVIEL